MKDYESPVVTWLGINRLYAQIEMDLAVLSMEEAEALRDRLTHLIEVHNGTRHPLGE